MSDVSQGPGWWIASDDKWYPPEDHPDRAGRADAPAAGPEATSDLSSLWSPTPRPVAEWSSPEVPAATTTGPPAPAATTTGPPAPEAPTTGPPVVGATAGRRRWTPMRLWILAALALIVLAAVALVVALRSDSSSGSSLPTGSATASIVVTLSHSGPPSFSGSLAGQPLTGTVLGNGVSTSSNGGALAVYRGTLGSEPYVLHVSLPNPGSAIQNDRITFRVTGTYGSEPVTATAQLTESSASARSLIVPITGRVGPQPISGEATVIEESSARLQIRANLVVLPSAI